MATAVWLFPSPGCGGYQQWPSGRRRSPAGASCDPERKPVSGVHRYQPSAARARFRYPRGTFQGIGVVALRGAGPFPEGSDFILYFSRFVFFLFSRKGTQQK